jgi:cell division protein FtsI (penicillin-binding protein 3)
VSSERVASPARLVVTGVLLASLAAGSTLLAGRIALGPDRDQLLAMAPAGGEAVRREPAIRGTITDRNGTILAVSVTRYRLVRDRLLSEADADRAVELLVGPLDVARDTLRDALLDRDRVYAALSPVLGETKEAAVRAALETLGLSGLRLEPRTIRLYPQTGGVEGSTLASTLLGFVNADGEGQYGIEGEFDTALRGADLVYREMRSAAGGTVPGTRTVLDPGLPGERIALTIDASLQASLEAIAARAATENGARTASIVVMAADTGAILSIAASTGFDANRYRDAAGDLSIFRNVMAEEVYAPGSVMKCVTAVAALEAGVATPDTRILDTAGISLDGGASMVHNVDRRGMGEISLSDVLAYSRNVGTTRLAYLLGNSTQARAEALYATWAKLGLTGPTGADLPAEAAGLARNPATSRWAEIDLSNASFGQGVSVTGLQLVAAYGAMINGGLLVVPRIADSVGSTERPVTIRGASLSPATSDAMRAMLRYVVDERYARDSVAGLLMGAKTGTAQVYEPTLGGFDPNRLDFTLMGFVEDGTGQRYVVAISVRDGTNFDHSTSVPAYRTAEIFEDVTRAMRDTLDLRLIRDLDGRLWRQAADPKDEQRTPVIQP